VTYFGDINNLLYLRTQFMVLSKRNLRCQKQRFKPWHCGLFSTNTTRAHNNSAVAQSSQISSFKSC